jgi:(p)ppGpp synthase/HD superfamily hydrolase
VASNRLVFEALEFAVGAHGSVGHLRKGTRFPYLIHPIRVGWILERHGYDDELVAAGLLHDTLEDTEVTSEQIAERFGGRVARYVEAATADKTLGWRPTREATIAKIAKLDADILPLLAADKVDNVRSIRDTLAERGEEETWVLFNSDRSDNEWYYRSLSEAFLARDPEVPLFQTLAGEVSAVFPD